MRMKRGNTLFVKVVTGLLAIILVIGVACFAAPNKRQVLAEENSGTVVKLEDANIDYKVKSYDDISIYRTKDTDGNFTVPTLTTDELVEAEDATPGEWLFAGWYKNEACTSSLSSSVVFEEGKPVNAGPYYAKFVPADVLSVKFQITTGTEPTSDDTVLRCVSTVDSLKYKGIGLHLVKPDGTVGKMENNKVNTRIKARADINVGAYSYSPKVVDTESEYFFSATEIIENENFADEYIVKPYWITKDGTTVWGVSRCVTVNAVINKDVIHIPVKMDVEPVNSSLTAGGNSLEYVGYDADSGYAHFSMNVNASALPSVSTYEIAGTYNTDKEVNASFTYRNLLTEYNGRSDTTWYNANEDELVIATSADLYGLASVVNNGNTLEKKTVYVVSDITVNKGTANHETLTWDPEGTQYEWKQIGQNDTSKRFAGIFDGQMHTISGICMNSSDARSGLFGVADINAVLKNFKLTNSYFKIAGKSYVGSIVGQIYGGSIENIYSNAIVDNKSQSNAGGFATGGLVGEVDITTDDFSMNNCWFDGTVTNADRFLGGLIGVLGETDSDYNQTITNCLNTGSLPGTSASSRWVGGLFGYNYGTKFSMSHCLNVGTIGCINTNSAQKATQYSLIGNFAYNTLNISCTYATKQDDFLNYICKGASSTPTYVQNTDSTVVAGESAIAGSKALSDNRTKNLFTYVTDADTYANESYWAIVPGKTPVLSAFADLAEEQYQAVDTSWFNKNASTFTLKDAADLYGLSLLTRDVDNSAGFANETIMLGADVVVNNGITYNEAGVVGEATPIEWLSIGTSDAPFKGRFDGKGNNISGLYLNATSVGNGLFGHTGTDVTIQKFSLTNSYFYSSASAYSDLGSVVGRTEGGSFDSIFSNAIVDGWCNNIGGLVGRMEGQCAFSINNCWFDGTAIIRNSCDNIGGLIGHVKNESGQYTRTITNCLNSGVVEAINSGTKNMGGLIGYNYSGGGLTITNSLNTGELQYSSGVDTSKLTNGNSTYVYGLIAGQLNSATELTGVYTVVQTGVPDVGAGVTYSSHKEASAISGTTAMKNLQTFYTPVSENNRYKVYWAVTDTTPILGDFIEFAGNEVDAVAFDTTWYDASGNYTLYDASDLYGFAKLSEIREFNNETVKLGADIFIPNKGTAEEWAAATKVPSFNWLSIGSADSKFNGTFDGQGNNISGIYLNATSVGNGLFGHTSTDVTIQNFSLTNSYFYSSASAYSDLGSVVGRTEGGSFDSIFSNAIVDGWCNNIGGLVGRMEGQCAFSINNCWFDGTAIIRNSCDNIGGLIGHVKNESGQYTRTITNCLNSGVVEAINSGTKNMGGLIGYNYSGGGLTITNSLNTGELQYSSGVDTSKLTNGNSTYVYGLIAGQLNSATELTGVYTVAQTGVPDVGAGVTYSSRKEASEITGAAARENLPKLFESKTEDGEDYWVVTSGAPVLATFAEYAEETVVAAADISWYNEDANVYTIRTADELYGLAKLCNDYTDTFAGKTIKLDSDICINKGVATEWEDGTHLPINIWTPIGITPSTAFAGTFDGQGHTISGIYLKSDSEYLGLFGILNTAGKATIKNLGLTNSYLECTSSSGLASGVHGLGSIAGQGSGRLDNVYSNAILVNGSTNTGGLVGSVVQSNVTFDVINCWFTGSVTGGVQDTTAENDWVGGIVGYATSDVTINMTNCLVAADISSKLAQGSSYVGGLSGRVGAGQIQSCMVVGTINYEQSGYACSIAGTTVNSSLSIQECYNATNTSQDWSNVAPTIIDVTRLTDCGAGNYNLEKANTTYEDYCSYLATLENKGFTKYATSVLDSVENDITSGVWNAIYTKEEMVMTVIYVAKTNKAYIAVGKDLPLSDHLLNQEKYTEGNVEGAKTTLHMPELHTYGDSFIIQLKNGHFILDDGGLNKDTPYLLDYLDTLVPEGEKPVIDAWFISHAHSDHYGALLGLVGNSAYRQRVYIEGVYFCEPNHSNLDWTYVEKLVSGVSNCITSSGAVTPVYRPQTGQRYYFNDITIDVLHTQEQIDTVDIADSNKRVNETSTWLLYTIEGQTFLHAGDTDEGSIEVVKNSYNQAYLDFDVMATFHHGQNVFESYVDYFTYKTVLYTTFVTGSQTANWHEAENEHMQECASECMSWGDGAKILTFPYTVGTATKVPLKTTWTYHPDRPTPERY